MKMKVLLEAGIIWLQANGQDGEKVEETDRTLDSREEKRGN